MLGASRALAHVERVGPNKCLRMERAAIAYLEMWEMSPHQAFNYRREKWPSVGSHKPDFPSSILGSASILINKLERRYNDIFRKLEYHF